MEWKNYYYLILFFLFSLLHHYYIIFFNYIFLVPAFLYLLYEKKISIKKIFSLSIGIFILSLINYYYLYGYGFNFMMILASVNVIFYLLFFYISKKLLFKKYYLFSIPSIYFILFYIFYFTIFNNFWVNPIIFLKYFPNSITIIGSYGNLFLIILFNLLIFDFLKNKFNFKKIPKINYFILILLIFNFFIFNNYFFEKNYPDNEKIKISGIQGNLNQDWGERLKNYTKNYNTYIDLSEKSIKEFKPQIIVWNEYVFTHPIEFDFILINKLKSFSNKNNITLIVGSILLENTSSSKSKRYDTLWVFQNNNILHYNAYEPVTLFDNSVIPEKNNPKFNLGSINYGLSICYEEYYHYIYSNLIKKEDVNFFILSGNLYYIKNDFGQKMIALNSRLRAFENNRYFFRIETSGKSQVIDNNGLVIKEIPTFKEGILNYEIPIIKEKNIYSLYQKQIDFLIFLISIIIIYFSIKRKN